MSRFFYRNLKKSYPIVESAQGVWVKDRAGNSYLDGSSGAIVANLGHGLAEINEAIRCQLERVAFAHTSQFVSQPGLDVADKLIQLAPPSFAQGRVYFTSGGSESIETAIKMCRSYWVERGQTQRTVLISRRHSYHGSTVGALRATGHPARRKPYLPMLGECVQIRPAYSYRCECGASGSCRAEDCSRIAAQSLERAILEQGPDKVMGFLAEPIVGAALGAAVPADSYWPRIRDICTKYGILLIADEVMTGLGRVGVNFGLDLWQVEPDIIALGKGLAAGYMPLGAVVASAQVAKAFEEGTGVFEHGFTYSGHPLALAAGNAVLDYLAAHKIVQRVSAREASFFERFKALQERYDFIGDVRGRGFLAGIELVRQRASKEPFDPQLRMGQRAAIEAGSEGLLIYPGQGCIDGNLGDHFMVAPPLVISESEMDELFYRLDRSLARLNASLNVTHAPLPRQAGSPLTV